jgi:WD40 repeat protein
MEGDDVLSVNLVRTLKHKWVCDYKCMIELADGNICLGTGMSRIVIWNPHNGEFVKMIRVHTSYDIAVDRLVQLLDGSVVVIINTCIYIWDILTEKCVLSLKHDGRVYTVLQVSQSVLVSSGSNGEINIWDLTTGNCLRTVCTGFTCATYNLLLWDSDSFACSVKGMVWVINTVSGDVMKKMSAGADNQSIITMIKLRSGRLVTSHKIVTDPSRHSFDFVLRVWDSTSGDCIKEFPMKACTCKHIFTEAFSDVIACSVDSDPSHFGLFEVRSGSLTNIIKTDLHPIAATTLSNGDLVCADHFTISVFSIVSGYTVIYPVFSSHFFQ